MRLKTPPSRLVPGLPKKVRFQMNGFLGVRQLEVEAWTLAPRGLSAFKLESKSGGAVGLFEREFGAE